MSIDYDITTGAGIDYEISADEPITADVGDSNGAKYNFDFIIYAKDMNFENI